MRAVLRDPAFRRSLRRTLIDRLLAWLAEWLEKLMQATRHLPSLRSVGLTIVALIVLFVLVRALISARGRADETTQRARRRGATVHENPWEVADRLTALGDFEEAAHALYRGVLLTVSRADRIRLDPSRTSGDYAREMRRRGSASLTMFRVFTRRFESAVYGHERCTAEILAELRTLAEPFRPRVKAA